MKFDITVERDEEGRYVVECTDLPGCLSEGETLTEAIENISEAILGCLKSRTAENSRSAAYTEANHILYMRRRKEIILECN